MRTSIWSAIALCSLTISNVHSADGCGKSTAQTLVSMRLSEPLLAVPGGDSSTRVTAKQDGCVEVSYPAWDTRSGTYRYQLSDAELAHLRAELVATRVEDFDATRIRLDLQRAAAHKQLVAPDAEAYYVSDEAVIELTISGRDKAGATAITWTGLRGQLLNHPDNAALVGLAAMRDRLLELGADHRMQKVQQP